jgi:F-type H+-transporting ATPase subunit delta
MTNYDLNMKILPKQYALALYEEVLDKKKSEAKSIIEDFARLIYANNDIAKLDKIISEFEKIWNREEGIVEAEVISARELNKATVKQIKNYIVELTRAKEVSIEEKLDKNLLGGVVLKYGDKVLDGSIKTKLNDLKNQMIR